ncbi:hypothetical protein BJV82DRAFT_596842 [Fennellomyces sp. T-0311]|nr:hypothetical protein BJV82DRAFT_596842 [Fennellomyces sp. T-0311]
MGRGKSRQATNFAAFIYRSLPQSFSNNLCLWDILPLSQHTYTYSRTPLFAS